MKRSKRLLAATDFSAPARHAAIRAAMLAREIDASLDVLHVVTTRSVDRLRTLVDDFPVELEQRLFRVALDEIQQLGELLEPYSAQAPEVHVVSGALLTVLVEQADRIAADLVVLASQGTGFLRHILIGSTTEKMLRKTMRPLLVVKQAPHEPYRRLLVSVDFSPYSLRAIEAARKFVPDAHIVLLHVFDVPFEGRLQYAGVEASSISYYRAAAKREATENLNQLARQAGLTEQTSTLLVLNGDISLHILEQERIQDCDLIVMGKHGDSMIEELLLGSVTRQILTESHADVLVSV